MNDLDTRVAALSRAALKIAEAVQNKDVIAARQANTEFECAVRTELQKPALHEPVSDQETIDAIRACHLKVTTESMIDMRRALESFLQGRAQPGFPEGWHMRDDARERLEQPAQEEVTDAERYQFAAKHLVLAGGGSEFGWNIAPVGKVEWDRYLDAAIRASKGEK